jgi:WD40 repeat protein
MSSPRTRYLVLCLLFGGALIGLSRHQAPGPQNPARDATPEPALEPIPGPPELPVVAEVIREPVGVAVAPEPRPAPVDTPLPAGAVLRFGEQRFRHPAALADLMFAAGGQWLVGCGESGGARIWDVRTGRVVRRFGEDTSARYHRIHLSPDNRTLSVIVSELMPNTPGKWNLVVRRYDVHSGSEAARIPLPETGAGWITHAAFSPDGAAVFAGASDGALVKYDLTTGKSPWRYKPHPGYQLQGLAVSPDGGAVVATSTPADGQVRLLDAATGQPLADLNGIVGGPGRVGFAGHGRTLATATAAPDAGVTIWERNPLTLRRVLPVTSSPFFDPVFAPDGKTVAVWGWLPPSAEGLEQLRVSGFYPNARSMSASALHLFDPTTGARQRTLPLGVYGRFGNEPVAFSPDGALVAVGGTGVTLWNAVTGVPLVAPETPWGEPHFSADGKQVRDSRVEGDDVVTRDAVTGRELKREPKVRSVRPTPSGFGPALLRSPDGRLVASGPPVWNSEFGLNGRVGAELTISVRDAGTDLELVRIPTARDLEQPVAFSPDGKQLATSDYHAVRVYDLITQETVLEFAPGSLGSDRLGRWRHWLRLGCVRSPDGRYLAVVDSKAPAEQQTVMILSTVTWQVVRTVAADPHERLDWSGNTRFTTRTGEAYFVEPATGTRTPVSFGGGDFRVVEWDVVTGCLSTRRFEPPARSFRTMSPNGCMLAVWKTEKEDGGYVIRVFEVESGRERHRFVCPDSCRSATFAPDGRYLLGHHPGLGHILWDVRGVLSRAPEPLDGAALERAWDELASDDAAVAFRTIQRLADNPARAVPLLRAKVPPARSPDPAVVGQLIAGLDSEEFREREDAEKELERLGKPVVPALWREVRVPASPEVVRRAAGLIHRIGIKAPPGPHLVAVRAVEAVEWMDTPEAVRLLDEWAGGAEGLRLTTEAKAALERRRK